MTERVWVLNLDAEHELMGRPTDPLAAIARRPDLVRSLRQTLVPAGDRIALSVGERHEGARGRAFSPTPRALACLASLGASAPAWAPGADVLSRVSSRVFSAELGLALPGARVARSVADVERAVGEATPSGAWLLRRVYGFAGNGRRVAKVGPLGAADRGFAAKALSLGALLVEPWVAVALECSLHGFVGLERTVLGRAVVSDVGPGGVWRASRLETGELDVGERRALETEAGRAGAALRAAGYRGPFGVDGFRWSAEASVGFVARSEINARYTMAWGLGMGDARPDLDG